MEQRRTLKELTIKDNFLFGAVMLEEENCRCFLEMALGFSIGRVEVSKERSMVYHPEYKGVRLDIYAKDEDNTHYNVEMQVVRRKGLAHRTRYYHSQMDMELLLSGSPYTELPDVYVIFICDFDPFGMKKYCYTFDSRCQEVEGLRLNDGAKNIFLSTRGENAGEIPEQMVKFLKFVKADLTESVEDFGDDFVKRLQDSIRKIKSSREMEERYMIFEEMLQDERREGIKEGRKEGRKEGGIIHLIALTRKKVKKGMSQKDIAEFLEEDIQLIGDICHQINAHPEEDDEQICARILSTSRSLLL